MLKTARSLLLDKRSVAVIGIHFLVTAQMIWWIVFFEQNHRAQRILENELDSRLIAQAAAHPSLPLPPEVIRTEKGPIIRPEVLENRVANHRRKFIMLISETAFILIVIAYGSTRIIRSIEKESRLAKERTIFINSITHELKTPLSALLLNIQTLEKHSLSKKVRGELLKEGMEQVRRLNEQINNLLLGGEIERKETRNTRRFTQDAAQSIRNLLKENTGILREEKAVVETSLEDNISLAVDPDLFSKILSNLLSNAIRYSPGAPRIRIELSKIQAAESAFSFLIRSRKKPECVIRFGDNGSGIPEAELENIFKPFYRLQNDTRAVTGTGLGLHLVRQIVESAGGSIRAKSDGENRGTVFTIQLPVIRNEESA